MRKRRQQLSKAVDTARSISSGAATAYTLPEERKSNLASLFEAAIARRDLALPSFPEGVAAALAAGRSDLASATAEAQSAKAELASLDKTMALRKARIEEAVADARARCEKARIEMEAAQDRLTQAMTARAAQAGRLTELRRLRDAVDPGAAETRLREATERYAALPVPECNVTKDDVSAAKNTEGGVRLELEGTDRDIQRAHGALEQVGGSVARERLRDATEAFELAQQQEREDEANYEAWKLLLDQLKEADAAQASNLGLAIAPAIASRFQALTDRRYETVRLTATLGTEGVVAAGAVRPSERISVGTREQLSTLYRLSLAEYLQTVVVLDDQLVQSDESRMDWFRALLKEKCRSFQIIVFTCRPRDYLEKAAMVPRGKGLYAVTDDGFTRAVDLGRALARGQVSALLQSIESRQPKLAELKAQRKNTPKHVLLKDLPQEDRFTRLAAARKHLVDTVKLVAYRAETALVAIARESLSRQDDARALVRQLLASSVDLQPDLDAKTLTVRLHRLSTAAHDAVLVDLCEELTATETLFPGTDLRLVFSPLGPA